MEPRTIAAYVIIALLIIGAVGVAINMRYNSQRRKDDRLRRHKRKNYEERFP